MRSLLCLCLISFASWGFAQQLQQYQLGPGDKLKIRVLNNNGTEEINDIFRIDDLGFLSLPIMGRLKAQGLSAEKLTEHIRTKLNENYLNNPQVLVEVDEYNFQPISVIGAVKKPGQLKETTLNMTLIEAVTLAGGLESNAGDRILVMRKAGDGLTETLELSLDDLFIKGKPEANIPLFPGDFVNVPIDTPMIISVLGEVGRPGELKFSKAGKVTLLRVIAAAGGFSDFAKKSRILVKRDHNGKTEEFRIDVRDIESSKRPDFEMKHNDLVVVP